MRPTSLKRRSTFRLSHRHAAGPRGVRARPTRDLTAPATAWLCAFGLVAALGGCTPEEKGPELPPEASMTVDVSAFKAGAASGKTDGTGTGDTSHAANAWTRVAWLNTAVVVGLAAPRLALRAALSQRPSFANGAWNWLFNVKAGGDTLAADLTGRFGNNAVSGSDLDLEMRLTCTGCKVPTDNFLWYTGRFDSGARSGQWQLFHPDIAQDDKTFVHIAWEITDPTHKTLTFTNKRTDGHADAGDVIQYLRDGDALSVTVHDADKALDYTAEISVATGAGWLQVPGYNKGEKACWDSERVNTPCP